MSNFSNSLENISQEIIEIPFGKKRMIVTNKENNAVSNRNSRVLEFSRKHSSIENKKGSEVKNGSLDMPKQKSKQNMLR